MLRKTENARRKELLLYRAAKGETEASLRGALGEKLPFEFAPAS